MSGQKRDPKRDPHLGGGGSPPIFGMDFDGFGMDFWGGTPHTGAFLDDVAGIFGRFSEAK